jgi:hypothetical protein
MRRLLRPRFFPQTRFFADELEVLAGPAFTGLSTAHHFALQLNSTLPVTASKPEAPTGLHSQLGLLRQIRRRSDATGRAPSGFLVPASQAGVVCSD